MSDMKFQPHAPDSSVCALTLGKLGVELGPDSVDAFISTFESMWATRISRLNNAVVSNDILTGEDASLSLKSAATMVGAHELAHLASLLHAAFRHDQKSSQDELIGRIERAGNTVLYALSEPGFAEGARQAYLHSASA